jgi:hypothetical protein
MITIVLLLLGVLVGAIGGTLVRRHSSVTSSLMLTDLRDTLEEMERDYRIRVATEELSQETRHQLGRPVE